MSDEEIEEKNETALLLLLSDVVCAAEGWRERGLDGNFHILLRSS